MTETMTDKRALEKADEIAENADYYQTMADADRKLVVVETDDSREVMQLDRVTHLEADGSLELRGDVMDEYWDSGIVRIWGIDMMLVDFANATIVLHEDGQPAAERGVMSFRLIDAGDDIEQVTSEGSDDG